MYTTYDTKHDEIYEWLDNEVEEPFVSVEGDIEDQNLIYVITDDTPFDVYQEVMEDLTKDRVFYFKDTIGTIDNFVVSSNRVIYILVTFRLRK